MERNTRSLVALALGCTLAAALFGFGAEVFSYRSAYEGFGREPLIQATRLFVYVALGVLLAFRGGWPGVLAAILMALLATSLEWALFPASYWWAALEDPDGYADKFGGVQRPPYSFWITYDVLGVGISAALAQGLRTMALANPRDP
jgi:fatty acid desaturase